MVWRGGLEGGCGGDGVYPEPAHSCEVGFEGGGIGIGCGGGIVGLW